MQTLGTGELTVDVFPDRSLDLGSARFRNRVFSWISPLGFVPWQGDFARSGGGLLVTCGLRNAGAASEGQPQHGWYSSQAARDVVLGSSRAGGRVVDAEVPGPTLELTREVAVDGRTLRVTDVTRNLGAHGEAAPLLYHVNLLWSSIDIDSDDVVSRDADAGAEDWRTLGPPSPEYVSEHLGGTRAVAVFGDLRVTVRSNLPRLWQWVHPEYGVLGIEPANCSVLGRARDQAEGRLPELAPDESRTSTLDVAVETA